MPADEDRKQFIAGELAAVKYEISGEEVAAHIHGTEPGPYPHDEFWKGVTRLAGLEYDRRERRQRRIDRKTISIDSLFNELADTTDHVKDLCDRDQIDQLLSCLDQDQNLILRLAKQHQMNHEDIGKLLHLTRRIVRRSVASTLIRVRDQGTLSE